MKNIDVAEVFEEIADLLELKGDNPFKIRAYRRAAQSIRSLGEDLAVLAGEGRLAEISGVGKDLAAKIEEMIRTGRMKRYEELKKKVPGGMLELMSVPGIGPKKSRLLYEKLKIKSIAQLEKKALAHKISGKGLHFRAKTEENILRGISLVKKRSERMNLEEALNLSGAILEILKKMPEVKKVEPAGSLRRMKETVRDIDILITSKKPARVMEAFTGLPLVRDVMSHGRTKSSILTKSGVQVDLRVVDADSFGAAMVYFTGSKAHNIHLRHMAKKMGLKVNEYGVFKERSGRSIAGKDEADVYRALGLKMMPAELREDRGEIEAALKGRLPKIVELSQIKGDLHVHSEWSDGSDPIEEIASRCKALGYEYVAVTDHSKTLKVAGGLSEKDVLKKLEEIRALNERVRGLRILAGVEVDILGDGTLDYGKDTLKRFDVVVASIHSGFRQPRDLLTGRIIKALGTGLVDILAHPTCRLMGTREPSDIDFEKVFRAARDSGAALEINAFPDRMDLDDTNARAAKDAGVKISLGTDSHSVDQLGHMSLGVSVCRRAWLEEGDILNTMGLKELLKFLNR